jgi:hypothetical protein
MEGGLNRMQVFAATAVGLALGATWTLSSGVVFGQSQQSVQVPKFQYDPTFPQPLPENWAIGAIGRMAVDSHDHIFRTTSISSRALPSDGVSAT